jgi:glycosyltransferase involved in cell wall biosynthesis
MQNYEPLVNYGYSLTGVAPKDNFFPLDEIHFPIEIFSTLLPNSKGRASHLIRKVASFVYGGPKVKFIGLENFLANFDIIHTAEIIHYYTYQAVKAKMRNKKLKLVTTVWENIPFVHDRVRIYRRIKGKVLPYIDHYLAVTEKTKCALILEGVEAQKISVLPMGVDLTKFYPSPKDSALIKEFNLKEDDFIILSIGRVVWEKGFYDIVHAARLLLTKSEFKERVRFIIIGKGNQLSHLIDRTKKLGLTPYFRFKEAVPYQKLPLIYNLANIFVLASIPAAHWQEQFGMVLLESMACGKPIVSTYCGAIPEIVGEAGILVPPADPLSLSRALEKLILDEKLREKLGSHGVERAKALFDSREVAKKIKEIYEKISG